MPTKTAFAPPLRTFSSVKSSLCRERPVSNWEETFIIDQRSSLTLTPISLANCTSKSTTLKGRRNWGISDELKDVIFDLLIQCQEDTIPESSQIVSLLIYSNVRVSKTSKEWSTWDRGWSSSQKSDWRRMRGKTRWTEIKDQRSINDHTCKN